MLTELTDAVFFSASSVSAFILALSFMLKIGLFEGVEVVEYRSVNSAYFMYCFM